MKRILQIVALVMMMVLSDFSAARGESPPESAFISGFVGHAQNYAIDCEIRSAVDWAGFWGVNIGETEFLNALPRSDNPEVGFVGDPNDVWGRIPPYGYGVHAEPIAKKLRDYGLKAEAYHDLSWDTVRQEIDAGRPVIVWIIGGMWDGKPVDYAASDGSTVRVAAYEHTMTLVGYSSETVKVVDASSGYLDTYRLSDFLDSWAVLSNMAVLGTYEPVSAINTSSQERVQHDNQGATRNVVLNIGQNISQNLGQNTSSGNGQSINQSASQSADQENDIGIYTVQRGDYVMKLARRFGVNWLELAQLNSLRPPYIIYPGQVLQLPVAVGQEVESSSSHASH